MKAEHSALRSVVVTGIGSEGAVREPGSALEALRLGKTTLSPLGVPSAPGFPTFIGSRHPVAPPFPYVSQRKWVKYMSATTQFAVWAAGRALEQAGLLGDSPACREARASSALYIATGPIAFEAEDVLPALAIAQDDQHALDLEALGARGLPACSPMMPFQTLLNMPMGIVSMVYGICGANLILYPNSRQATGALELAIRGIAHGRFDRALVGGSAQLTSLLPLLSLAERGLLAPSLESAVPFSPAHQGWAPGDGAAFLVLEAEAAQRSRGVKALARIATASQGAVDGAVCTGTHDRASDALLLDRLTALSPERPIQPISLDSVSGYWGAAAMPFAVGVGVALLQDPGGSCKRVAVLSAEPESPTQQIWLSSAEGSASGGSP